MSKLNKTQPRAFVEESEHEEIMRTKFVHVLLEEQWAKVGRRQADPAMGCTEYAVLGQASHALCCKIRQFRLELVLYLIYLVGFAGWCITGRASCADPGPPEDEAQDFNNLVGVLAALADHLSFCSSCELGSIPSHSRPAFRREEGGPQKCFWAGHSGPQKGPGRPVGFGGKQHSDTAASAVQDQRLFFPDVPRASANTDTTVHCLTDCSVNFVHACHRARAALQAVLVIFQLFFLYQDGR